MADDEKPDVMIQADGYEGSLAAYRLCKERQAQAETQAEEWKNAADKVLEALKSNMELRNGNVGTINGKPAFRYTRWTRTTFSFKKYQAKDPDGAEAMMEAFNTKSQQSRFTLYDYREGN